MSNSEEKSGEVSIEKSIKDFSKIKNEQIDEYIEVMTKLLENNEIIILPNGRIKIRKNDIIKYYPLYKGKEQEISDLLADMFLFTFVVVEGKTFYDDVKDNKKIKYLMKKLKENELFNIICSRFLLERNYFINSEYNFLDRNIPEYNTQLTTCELHISYNNLEQEIKEIVIELDKVQLNYFAKQIQKALDSFKG